MTLTTTLLCFLLALMPASLYTLKVLNEYASSFSILTTGLLFFLGSWQTASTQPDISLLLMIAALGWVSLAVAVISTYLLTRPAKDQK